MNSAYPVVPWYGSIDYKILKIKNYDCRKLIDININLFVY